MIKSFADRDTERLFAREPVRRFPAVLQRAMLRKLVVLDAVEVLEELRVPPGNQRGNVLDARVSHDLIQIIQPRMDTDGHG